LRGDGFAVGAKYLRPTVYTEDDVFEDLSSRHQPASCIDGSDACSSLQIIIE